MGYNPATGDDVHKVELSNIKYIAIFDIVEPACQLLDYIVYPSSTHLHITQCPVSGGGDGSQVDFKSAFSSDFWTRCPLMLGSSIDQIDFHRPHQKAFLGISCTFEGESHPRLIYDTWHWDVNATDLFVYITRLNLSRVRHMRYRSDDGGQPCAEQWVHLLCRMPALVSIHFNEMDFGGWSCCGLIIALDSSVGVPDHPESTFLPNLKHNAGGEIPMTWTSGVEVKGSTSAWWNKVSLRVSISKTITRRKSSRTVVLCSTCSMALLSTATTEVEPWRSSTSRTATSPRTRTTMTSRRL
jgi:hypothetical protein